MMPSTEPPLTLPAGLFEVPPPRKELIRKLGNRKCHPGSSSFPRGKSTLSQAGTRQCHHVKPCYCAGDAPTVVQRPKVMGAVSFHQALTPPQLVLFQLHGCLLGNFTD